MDLQALRRHFPHTETSVYVNHAATGPLSTPVMAAIDRYLQQRHAGEIDNYFAFAPVVDETKQRLAALIGTDERRVEYVPNTSYGLNLLVSGLDWQAGDRIAVPGCEFPANVYPFLSLARRGVEVDFIPHDRGVVPLEAVERTLTPRTRLLSISWVQFLSGYRADLEALGALCRDRGVIFCVDAIQGLGALRLDVEACGIDFLACGGHKWLLGTQGLGFVYVSEALQERIHPPAGWLHGPVDWDNFFDYELAFHDDASRYRLGTLNHVGVAAMHAALGLYAEAGVASCEAHVLALARRLAEGLERLGLRRYGTDDPRYASGIVTVEHPEPEGLFEALARRSVRAALRQRMIRFSPTYYNTPGEIDAVIDAVSAYA